MVLNEGTIYLIHFWKAEILKPSYVLPSSDYLVSCNITKVLGVYGNLSWNIHINNKFNLAIKMFSSEHSFLEIPP